jgi:DNA gyrase subunit A
MKDDAVEVVVDEDGNVIESEAIERVKPVLEILEDDGAADEDEDEDDVEESEEDIDDEDDSEDEETE